MFYQKQTRRRSRPDDAALVLAAATHVEEAAVCDGEDVRRQLAEAPVGVQVHLLRCVDGQQLVGVHGHQDGARVRLHVPGGRTRTRTRSSFIGLSFGKRGV